MFMTFPHLTLLIWRACHFKSFFTPPISPKISDNNAKVFLNKNKSWFLTKENGKIRNCGNLFVFRSNQHSQSAQI